MAVFALRKPRRRAQRQANGIASLNRHNPSKSPSQRAKVVAARQLPPLWVHEQNNSKAMSSTIAYIIIGVSVLFIIGIKLLASPKTARIGNLVAAAGMFIALLSLHKPTGEYVWSQGWTFNYTLIAIGTVIGLDHRRDRRVFGEDDRDAADGRALQRPRRRRGGAGREPGISTRRAQHLKASRRSSQVRCCSPRSSVRFRFPAASSRI